VPTRRNPARMRVRCEATLSRVVSAITLDSPWSAATASRATTASAALTVAVLALHPGALFETPFCFARSAVRLRAASCCSARMGCSTDVRETPATALLARRPKRKKM